MTTLKLGSIARRPAMTGFLLLLVFFVALVLSSESPFISKRRAMCDRAVDALLTSKDLVEVTRAGIIVNQIDCSIARRLPALTSP
jgi:hypothetical protein